MIFNIVTFVNILYVFMEEINEVYKSIKSPHLFGRYFFYDKVINAIEKLPHLLVESAIIGYSVLGKPIYKLCVGKGPIKLLIWSQMHGNESTSTKAIFDFLAVVEQKKELVSSVLDKLTIHIIPVLNPDGLMNYTRENANGVDLNRDAIQLKQPESIILRNTIEDLIPHFCFNMHGQRTIFSAGYHPNPATMSFLSPSVNNERSVTSVRKKVMQLIVCINETLQKYIPNQVGRYDDDFNINCTGDYFQSKGIPVLLFESGHYPNDYEREEVRRLTFIALFKAISSLSTKDFEHKDYNAYFDIPKNQKLYYDFIVRNIKIENKLTSIAVQYKEELQDGKINFTPFVAQINELDNYWGHQEIDAQGSCAEYDLMLLQQIPKLDSLFDLNKFKLLTREA